jgi:ferric-dicitrate binding protein FerR (iron transport regulator)
MKEKKQIEELIAKLFSEKITPEERAMLTDWLKGNDENKMYFAQLRNIWQVSHPAFKPAEIDVAAAELQLNERITFRNRRLKPVLIWWQRVAAIIVLPLMLTIGYMISQKSPQPAVTAYQEIISPPGVTSKVDLPDGSTVWLNSGSKLKYPVVFASTERDVFLTGEAFFKVHSDKKHPFIVGTKNINVRATGTLFNVEAYSEDTISAVTLLEGKVDVSIYGSDNEKLQPNQRIVLNSISKSYKLTQTNARLWSQWKDGVLAFRDQPLEDVFKRIGRTFNVDIEIKDPVVSHQLYRATFEGESFEEILRLLQMSAPIQYKRIVREKNAENKFTKDKIEVYRAK